MAKIVTENHFRHGGMKYFRNNAHRVELGSFGRKFDPVGPRGGLHPAGRIRRSLIAPHIRQSGVVEVDWSKVSDRDFGADADLRYLGMSANSSHRLNLSRARSAGLKLISLAIDTLRMEDILNEANRARNEMADEGRDARVVIETWVVVEAELADAVSRGGRHGVSVSAAGQSLSLRFGGNSRSSHTVVLPENATFAYALGKVSDWGRRRETVEDVDLDYKGLN